MKPILVDAIYINMGGAFMILDHLVNHLVEKEVNFVLLKDVRCEKLDSEDRIQNLVTLPNSEKARKEYYKENRTKFHSVLCMGNVPPTIKLNVPVHTYIHNVSLLAIPKHYPLKWKIKCLLKKNYINLYSKNTDSWIVQTDNTKSLVKKHLNCKNKPIYNYPIYFIPDNINHSPLEQRKDYVFIGEYTYAKGHEYLIDAWGKLAKLGFYKNLHLTVNFQPIKDKINEAVAQGANIENHGRISFQEVVTLYNKSKAIIYPSINESLGLGIIEAIHAGCDVLGCDLSYIHSVCIPSGTFQPMNSDSIVDAVLKYEKNQNKKTKLLISDKVSEFISFLKNRESIE